MTPQQFIAKWQRVHLSERSACQQHFLDLCELLDQPKPAAADPDGQWYTFEKGVKKIEGGDGWADVWMRGHFGWEYKRRHKDLKEAYSQLLLYREDLENPPLLVVCDMDRFEVHTNFTATAKRKYEFDLAGLAEPDNLDVLRKLFTDPESLRPGITSESLTVEAARRFAELADAMRQKGVEPLRAAHFLMKLMFCMFGEDVGLLPAGLFSGLLDDGRAMPASLNRRLEKLFAAMEKGGDFGPVEIPWFNGGLFADNDVIPLTTQEINILIDVNGYDWTSVEPSIFGTLFERTLDPGKRSQIGAHYTSRADIETLLEPVLLDPLRREWDAVKRKCEEKLWPTLVAADRARRAKSSLTKPSRQRKTFERAILDFAERLHHVTVLDPACGSGNFLYVAIHMLLDLEKEVVAYAANHGLALFPQVSPSQLRGLEINPYAQQLAQVVIWIGYLQWMHYNGFREPRNPVLQPIENIRCQDAILDLSDPENPKEPKWPDAEFIVGNPPFLGGNRMRQGLGDRYVECLFAMYANRVPAFSDLCCYWLEKARNQITTGKCKRAGLLATQAIRGGTNRDVLKRIKETGDIFFAESDRDWILDGAAVHISMVGFDDGTDTNRLLNGGHVIAINAVLGSHADVSCAVIIPRNQGISFQGPSPKAPFDISFDAALDMLREPLNVHGCPNSDVLRPVITAKELVQVRDDMWTFDFGLMSHDRAACYASPFEYVRTNILPIRKTRRDDYRGKWWQYARPRTGMREALAGMSRFCTIPRHAKHRIFVWLDSVFVANDSTIVFAHDDDCFFGVLQSHIHEVWALRLGTRLETRPRYTPTTCFETFPLPECVWNGPHPGPLPEGRQHRRSGGRCPPAIVPPSPVPRLSPPLPPRPLRRRPANSTNCGTAG